MCYVRCPALSHLSNQEQQFTSRIYSKDALGFSDNEIHHTMTIGYWRVLDTNKVTLWYSVSLPRFEQMARH